MKDLMIIKISFIMLNQIQINPYVFELILQLKSDSDCRGNADASEQISHSNDKIRQFINPALEQKRGRRFVECCRDARLCVSTTINPAESPPQKKSQFPKKSLSLFFGSRSMYFMKSQG